MSKEHTNEYLRLIKENVDPNACIDKAGNVVYVQQVLLDPPTTVIKVTPEECEQIINDMYGAPTNE